MDTRDVDRLVRAMAAGLSRRSMVRRAAGSALTSPLGLFSLSAASAQDKDKGKDKDKDNDKGNPGGPGNSACRDVGHPCEGNQICCPGLVCGPFGPGNARRCGADTTDAVTEQTHASQTVINTTNQTVVQNTNQVCAGNLRSDQPAGRRHLCQSVGAGGFRRPRRAPSHLLGRHELHLRRPVVPHGLQWDRSRSGGRTAGAEDQSADGGVLRHRHRRGFATGAARNDHPHAASSVQWSASAGNGGVANADASGGSVSIGNVSGSNDIAIDASGGTANADASGGNNNVAVVGGSQGTETLEQVVEPSSITLTLEGNVVPGKSTTYWLDTDAGRRPATGPSLVQVADETNDTGAILIDTWTCPIGVAQAGFDWFGQCTTPAVDMQFSVYPATGGTTPLATSQANAQGHVRFANLPPGTYQVRPEGTIWCYAEGDRLDSNGNVIVESQAESHVWSFVCSGGGGS